MTKHTPLITLSEQTIKHYLILFGTFTLLTHLSLLFSLSFKMTAFIGLIIFIVTTCSFSFSVSKIFLLLINTNTRKLFLFLILIATLTGLYVASANFPDEDDSLYVPPAVQALAQPEKPLSFEFNWIAPSFTGIKFKAHLSGLATGIQYFWASFSYWTGFSFLTSYQVINSYFLGFIFTFVTFFFISRFNVNEIQVLSGTTVSMLVAVFIFRENNLGFGSTLVKFWIGKNTFYLLVIPIVTALAVDYFKHQSLSNWGFIALAAIAATGMTTSCLFLFPLLLLTLISTIPFNTLLKNAPLKTKLFVTFCLLSSGFYPIFLALYFKFFSSEVIAFKSLQILYDSRDLYWVSFSWFFGSITSVSTGIIFISLLFLFSKRNQAYSFLITLFLMMIILLINPFVTSFVADNLTSRINYARVFYLLPIFGLVGVAAAEADLINFYAQVKKHLLVRILFYLLILFAYQNWGIYKQEFFLEDLPNSPFGKPSFGFPAVRIDPQLIKDINEIEAILPAGLTLSSLDYAFSIPQFTTKFPQFSILSVRFYGETLGFLSEALYREAAMDFLNGATDDATGFAILVKSSMVKNLILSPRFENVDLEKINLFLTTNGYTQVAKTSRYILYTQKNKI
jgi:hypothetical protein